MNDTIHLEPKSIPSQLRGGYTGRKFKAIVAETYTIPSYAGNWDGGSRDTFTMKRIADGATIPMSDNVSAPWDSRRAEKAVTIEPGFVLVEHSIFCGKDMGLRFYIHPADVVKLLPEPVELTDHERVVLSATRSLKSSYNGQNRFQMITTGYKPNPITREQWDVATDALKGRKLLNKAGAITVAGRNAVGSKDYH